MIVAAQGTSGSGKSATLRALWTYYGDAVYIPEIVLPMAQEVSDDYFLRNDIAKSLAAGRSAQLVLMDRDFTSTLAFVRARDGVSSQSYRTLASKMETAIAGGSITLPHILLRFSLPAALSIARQNGTNAPIWRDVAFIERFEQALDRVIAEYFPASHVHGVDARLDRGLIFKQCISTISSYEAT